MNVPTNGRQVKYFPLKEHPSDRIFSQYGPPQAKAATICHVHGPACVNLSVIDQNGNHHSRSSVTLIQDGESATDDQIKVGGFAMWPNLNPPRAPINPPAHEQPEPGNADQR